MLILPDSSIISILVSSLSCLPPYFIFSGAFFSNAAGLEGNAPLGMPLMKRLKVFKRALLLMKPPCQGGFFELEDLINRNE